MADEGDRREGVVELAELARLLDGEDVLELFEVDRAAVAERDTA